MPVVVIVGFRFRSGSGFRMGIFDGFCGTQSLCLPGRSQMLASPGALGLIGRGFTVRQRELRRTCRTRRLWREDVLIYGKWAGEGGQTRRARRGVGGRSRTAGLPGETGW
jgi:hypothetical protein